MGLVPEPWGKTLKKGLKKRKRIEFPTNPETQSVFRRRKFLLLPVRNGSHTHESLTLIFSYVGVIDGIRTRGFTESQSVAMGLSATTTIPFHYHITVYPGEVFSRMLQFISTSQAGRGFPVIIQLYHSFLEEPNKFIGSFFCF